MSLTEKYKSVYENGWNGIMVWMQSIPEQDYAWYGYDFTKASTSAMAEYIPEVGRLQGACGKLCMGRKALLLSLQRKCPSQLPDI